MKAWMFHLRLLRVPLWPEAICEKCRSVASLTDVELDADGYAVCPTCGHTTFSSNGVPLPSVIVESTDASRG